MSFTLLRNQINDAYDFIRPFTSSIIIRAISAEEMNANGERNVGLLSAVIARLRSGASSDVEVAQFYITRADGPSVALFQEIITQAEAEANPEENPNPIEENEVPAEEVPAEENPEAQPANPNNARSNNGRMIAEFFSMFQ